MELNGKTALVTGAGRRLGRAAALALARAGADVAVHYGRSAEQAAAVAEEIRAIGRRAEVFRADLAEPRQIAEMFKALPKKFPRLDVLVNNAGVYDPTPIETLTPGQWDAEFAVNARAPALCIKEAIPLMADGGVIVNITDIAAEKAWAGYPAYCASKAALLALTKSTAKALAPKIRVNAVAPGVIAWREETTDKQKEHVLAQIPLRRPGSPEDVAAAVLFLIRADYITAQNLRVDGGWYMG
ncbi:MAG: SDR family oxidoreductase [Phycisphaerae bacterium]|nr:SDR family oxidoreductase [Phycisphaerae bacterium]